MVAQAGRKLVLKIDDGAVPTPHFITIGGMQTIRMQLEQEPYDASHTGSGAWGLLAAEAGQRRLRIDGEGVFEDSTAEELLRAAAFSGVVRQYALYFGNGDVIAAGCVVTRYVRHGQVGGLEEFALTLQSASAVSFVAG